MQRFYRLSISSDRFFFEPEDAENLTQLLWDKA